MSVLWQILSVVAFFALTCGTAFFVAAEFALAALEKSSVDTRAENGDARDRAVQRTHRSLSLQLSACQVGITLTTLVTGYLAEPLIARLLEPVLDAVGLPESTSVAVSLILALIIASYLSMVIGELVPKNLAITNPTGIARLTALPLLGFTKIFGFLIHFMDGAANAIVRRLGVAPIDENAARSSSELEALVINSAKEGSLDSDTAVILSRSLSFGELTAEDIMTPRSTVVSLAATDTIDDLVAAALETGYSRFPITQQGLDEASGMVHVKQALRYPNSDFSSISLASISRPVHRVPDSLDGDAVLNRIRNEGAQMLLVVDEYGGVAGIVTLEDVVEEIVGEVVDEYDDASEARPIARRGAWWDASGLVRLDEVSRATGYHAPAGPYETLAGLVVYALGRLPQVGDIVDLPNDAGTIADDLDAGHFGTWQALVTELDGRRIDRLTVGPNVAGSAPELVRAKEADPVSGVEEPKDKAKAKAKSMATEASGRARPTADVDRAAGPRREAGE